MNALRLAFGTLSVFPTHPPTTIDRRVAGGAMALAPLVAVALIAPLWLLTGLLDDRWSPYLVATAWVAGLAFLTRAMHLDGLADTADGLGSGKPPEAALEIMRKSDIGPFGVATIVLVLLVQVAAAAQLLARPDGPAYVAAGVLVSRLVLPFACSSRVPGARGEGLGSMVAGAVDATQVLTAVMVTVALLVGAASLVEPRIAVALVGLPVGLAFCAWCVRRLGGTTGDVLGACVEVTFTASLLAMTLA